MQIELKAGFRYFPSQWDAAWWIMYYGQSREPKKE